MKKRESILVVDDSPGTLEVLRRNLVSKGFLVLMAGGGAEAIGILDNNPVDLIITDVRMPDIDGFDLLWHIRENLKEKEVLLITGFPTVEGAVQAMKYGADNYLTKPFTDDELFEAVDRALEKLRF